MEQRCVPALPVVPRHQPLPQPKGCFPPAREFCMCVMFYPKPKHRDCSECFHAGRKERMRPCWGWGWLRPSCERNSVPFLLVKQAAEDNAWHQPV